MATILSGCGGGYDIYGAIPKFLRFKKTKKYKNIILVNLSFTNKYLLNKLAQNGEIEKISNVHFIIDAKNIKATKFDTIFAEYYLSKYLETQVHVINCDCTIRDIQNTYKYILEKKYANCSFYLSF